MDVLEAKKIVIEAGIKLVETGLIARTWGNVSCRIDENSFVITPSGKPYIGLTPDDIVLVKISDLSYDGNVKPSSEKGVHAEVYKAHKDANFVIHTHQKNASVISDLNKGISYVADPEAAIIGREVLIASYGLPGTGKLKKGVAAALAETDSKAIIMAHHGAVCFGKDCDEAFNVASTLETVCEKYILESAEGRLSVKAKNLAEFCMNIPKVLHNCEDYLTPDPGEKCSSSCNREKDEIVFDLPGKEESVSGMKLSSGSATFGELPEEAEYHRDIYTKRPEYNFIIHNTSPEVMAVSTLSKTMKPLLDDFAQIVGTKVKNTCYAAAPKALKKSNAVIIRNKGALCCGAVKGDAEAVDMIMSKNCLTLLGASVFGKPKKIGCIDSTLMRIIYLKKYSKQASE